MSLQSLLYSMYHKNINNTLMNQHFILLWVNNCNLTCLRSLTTSSNLGLGDIETSYHWNSPFIKICCMLCSILHQSNNIPGWAQLLLRSDHSYQVCHQMLWTLCPSLTDWLVCSWCWPANVCTAALTHQSSSHSPEDPSLCFGPQFVNRDLVYKWLFHNEGL